MRFDPEHPRPWSELRALLTADEAEDCLQFAAQHGVTLETAPPPIAEGCYQDWRLMEHATSHD